MIDENLPQTAKIGPYQYTIEVDSEEAWEWNHNARTFYRSHRFSFNDKVSKTGTPQTLMHEILHGLGEAYSIKYWFSHELAEKFTEDKDRIDLMATALLTFIRDNPNIIKYFQDTNPQ